MSEYGVLISTRDEIGRLIDCVARTVQSPDAENADLLRRLQVAYTATGERPCPVYGEARGTSECEKCHGEIINCPVYGPGERRRLEEDARASA